MSIELTEEQSRVLAAQDEAPVRAVDLSTNREYVLVPIDEYESLKLLPDRLDVQEAYPLMDAVAAKEGWDDPALDIYNKLDPRKKS